MRNYSEQNFCKLFQELTGHVPMRWQEVLFEQHFAKGDLPDALDIPTGLGKTSVMALWLIAHLKGIKVPRRLVYVVDRRAVVDQATTFAETLYQKVQMPEGLGKLSISTLRGQHVDNRKWLEDPAAPSIIIGTVDMIGSRLLFEGYGVSRKMRPYHAGLLGIDSLFVLDESHLVPPFQELLRQIQGGPTQLSGTNPPPFDWHLRMMALSATGAGPVPGSVFSLDGLWSSDKIARQRFTSRKELTLHESSQLEKSLAERAWALSQPEGEPRRVLVFCDSRQSAQKIHDDLHKRIEKRRKQRKETRNEQQGPIELLVGQRRVFEREQVAKRLRELGFLERSGPPMEPTFLVATAAGEVGVDLDADDLVCDLVPWERLIQRLGRVNRRGEGSARVEVWARPDLSKHETLTHVCKFLRQALGTEPSLDVSPAGLDALKKKAGPETVEAASTPPPRYPALTRAELESWTLTSLDVVDPSKPRVQPWLRGWVEDEPQTTLAWRHYLPTRQGEEATPKRGRKARKLKADIESFFEAAPVSLAEQLEAPTKGAVDWLQDCARQRSKKLKSETVVAYVLNPDLTLRERPSRLPGTGWGLRVWELRSKDRLQRELLMEWTTGAIVVVSAELKGLQDGLLTRGSKRIEDQHDLPETEETAADPQDSDESESSEQEGSDTSDDNLPRCADTPNQESFPGFYVKVRECTASEESKNGIFSFVTDYNDDGQPIKRLVVERRVTATPTSEDGRSVTSYQLLEDHQVQAELCAKDLADKLGLDQEYSTMLTLAARFHDEGKRAENWQRGFSVRSEKLGKVIYAKTPGPVLFKVLAGYRHELGTLIQLLAWVEGEVEDAGFLERWRELPPDLQELALHVIGAHHGGARPVLRTEGCLDALPSQLGALAQQIALRFASMQQQWGPWGLAWWEALLRSVDQRASKEAKDSKGDSNG